MSTPKRPSRSPVRKPATQKPPAPNTPQPPRRKPVKPAFVDTRDGPVPSDSDERCEHTDLLKTMCAHCRGLNTGLNSSTAGIPAGSDSTPLRPARPARPAFHEADDEDTDPDTVVWTFRAQYGGRCSACDGHYARGEWIYVTGGGDYLCPECGT
jgi:hypothetical protein